MNLKQIDRLEGEIAKLRQWIVSELGDLSNEKAGRIANVSSATIMRLRSGDIVTTDSIIEMAYYMHTK